MKNYLKIFGIIALVAIIGLSMVACAEDGAVGPEGPQGPEGPAGVSIVWKGEHAAHTAAALANPQVNWAYYNTTDGKVYIYTGSGATEGWKVMTQNGASIVWKGPLAAAPANPELNWAYYNTTNKTAYIYDGTAWQIMAEQGPPGPTDVFTVKFETGGGTQIPDQKVINGGWAYRPTKAVEPGILARDTAGLYWAEFTGVWLYEVGEDEFEEFDFDTPITGNITLIAEFDEGKLEEITNLLDEAMGFVQAYPNRVYTLLLGKDYTATPMSLYADGINLTIIGIGTGTTERRITLNNLNLGTPLFYLGDNNDQPSVSVTIGDRIELVGQSNNTSALVHIRKGSIFTMLGGSKITGNKNENKNPSSGTVSGAVEVTEGKFVMKGGEITGNSGLMGAVGVSGSNNFIMEGGSITGNENNFDRENIAGDIMVQGNSSNPNPNIPVFTLSGNATIGEVAIMLMDEGSGLVTCFFAVYPTWTGSIGKLDLLLAMADDEVDADTAAEEWENQFILKAAIPGSLDSAIENITLGNFVGIDISPMFEDPVGDPNVDYSEIDSEEYFINTQGRLVAVE